MIISAFKLAHHSVTNALGMQAGCVVGMHFTIIFPDQCRGRLRYLDSSGKRCFCRYWLPASSKLSMARSTAIESVFD
ncbi:MAG: hypothetical protein H6574_14355 [Lewinellaceae bacterium]|nr:hypothetical protein [Lewinellaceae bacterium]